MGAVVFLFYEKGDVIMEKKQILNSVYVVRVFDSAGNLLPAINAYRTRAGAEACIQEWLPKGQKAEIVEV